MAFGGFKLGQFRHFKKGAPYVAYDITVDEASQKEKVSYVRLSDGSKHSRFLDIFQDDVKDHPENETGQKQRFKLLDTAVTFAIRNKTVTPSEPAVIENGQLVKAEVLGEKFTTLKEFFAANGIPSVLSLKLGDTVSVWAPLVDDETNSETFVVEGITNHGVYVNGYLSQPAFLSWHQLLTITISFK